MIYRDAVADHDDLMVQRMRAAGAVIVGKSNVPRLPDLSQNQVTLLAADRRRTRRRA